MKLFPSPETGIQTHTTFLYLHLNYQTIHPPA